MKVLAMTAVIVLLAGCGGVHKARQGVGPVSDLDPLPISYGPINKACMASGRASGNSALCGCIQAVADRTLAPGQQSRAVRFYADPHLAQEIRQSDRAPD